MDILESPSFSVSYRWAHTFISECSLSPNYPSPHYLCTGDSLCSLDTRCLIEWIPPYWSRKLETFSCPLRFSCGVTLIFYLSKSDLFVKSLASPVALVLLTGSPLSVNRARFRYSVRASLFKGRDGVIFCPRDP